jgi:hypothetical protein
MSQETSQVVHVARPTSGTIKNITFTKGMRDGIVIFDFDVYEVMDIKRTHDNLIFIFKDEASITIEDYYITSASDLPIFQFANGTINKWYLDQE